MVAAMPTKCTTINIWREKHDPLEDHNSSLYHTAMEIIFGGYINYLSHCFSKETSLPLQCTGICATTNEARCVLPIFSSVHRRKNNLSTRGGTKVLCVCLLEKELLYVGHARWPSKASPLIFLPMQLEKLYFPHSAINSQNFAQGKQ